MKAMKEARKGNSVRRPTSPFQLNKKVSNHMTQQAAANLQATHAQLLDRQVTINPQTNPDCHYREQLPVAYQYSFPDYRARVALILPELPPT